MMRNVLSNKKVLLGISAIIIMIAVIAAGSFIPFIIDPKRWMTNEFLTDQLIIVAITIFAMIATIFIGQASNAANDKSEIAKSRVEFDFSRKQVLAHPGGTHRFRQWIKKVQQPNDIKTMKERLMSEAGIEDTSVIHLDASEIKSLTKAGKFGKTYYKSLTKEQIKLVLRLKSGKFKLNLVEPEYYLYAKTIIDTRTPTERSGSEGAKKSSFMALSVISKIVMTVIPSMIFASFMRDLASEGIEAGEAWLTFATRMFALMSSAFMGYYTGSQINDIEAEYVTMRSTVHNDYLKDEAFVCMTQQEEAKAEFAERVHEEETAALPYNR